MEINVIPKFLDEAVTPIAQSVGNTLSSIWTIVFGGIDNYAQKTQHKRVVALNKFKEELEQKTSSVPEENIVEPPLHIVGPSLEASKYYFESDELRTMFANLIAASINRDTIAKAHPSFVEIIKQLSPLDAINLKLFKTTNRYPIVRYDFLNTNNNGSFPYKTNVFLENAETMDVDLNATSISNLDRLGLVSITYKTYLSDDTFYKKYLDNPFFQKTKQEFEQYNLTLNPASIKFNDVNIRKGIVDITPLGESFIEICI
ncbi:DUF4393 domain-containing protein [Bacillus sp. H1a]|uniref:DUF4393 domain-containing protein n=1 Tax=Bacillus sp. H1a TaxID=1397276 RepID=UPI000468996D|nr:DUF4393 domain-containing protein [Bacillus sp. H1a]